MNNKLAYPTCPIHLDEHLQMVCLSCHEQSLACPLCIDYSHHMHEVISLKRFINHEVSKLHSDQPDYENLSQKMGVLNESTVEGIQRMRKQIGQEINQLQLFYQERAERFENELRFICGIYDSQTPNSLSENVEAAKIKINNKSKILPNSELSNHIAHLKQSMEQAINDSCVQIRRIIYNLKQLCLASSDIFLNSRILTKQHFDPQNCHGSLQVINESKLINKQYDNCYHSCVVMPALSPFRNSITFKITKTEHKCVWVGITELKSQLQSKFVNSYKTDGKHYMIWQAGGEGDAEFYPQNSQNRPMIKGWNFEEGDTVTVRIVYGEKYSKQIEFVKNEKSEDPTKFSSRINSEIGLYYACISLGDQGELVQIVQI